MRTQDSRVQIFTLVCAREDVVLTLKQFPVQYLVSAVLKMLADLTDAQNTLGPGWPMLHY